MTEYTHGSFAGDTADLRSGLKSCIEQWETPYGPGFSDDDPVPEDGVRWGTIQEKCALVGDEINQWSYAQSEYQPDPVRAAMLERRHWGDEPRALALADMILASPQMFV